MAPPRGNVRGNKAIRSFHSCEISHLDCRFFFFFFFFHSNFLARNYANFQLDDFPDDRYKKKKILSYESYPRYTLRVIFTKEKLNLQIQRWRDDPRLSVVALVAVRCARKNR